MQQQSRLHENDSIGNFFALCHLREELSVPLLPLLFITASRSFLVITHESKRKPQFVV